MKMFKQLLKKFFFKNTEDRSGFFAYPQTYKVIQTVALRAFDDAVGELILPVPATGEGQEVLAQTRQDLRFDPVYKNNYETIVFKLSKDRTLNLERVYEIKRIPIQVSAGDFDLLDYKSCKVLDSKFLTRNSLIDSDLPQVQKKAKEIGQKQKKLISALMAVNEYVIGTLRYGNPQNGLYSAEEALRGATVDCGGYDTLFASVCVALGIPARIVSGFWLGYEKNDMHAWVEIQLPDGRWMPADPSVEALRTAGRSKKSGGLGYIGADRVAFSYGCDIGLSEKSNFIADILQVPFVLPRSEEVKVNVSNKLINARI